MQKIFNFVKTNADILIVLVIGTAIRTREILRYEFWFDEAFTGILMHAPSDVFWLELERDVHPPLYNLLTKGWTMIAGINEVTLRLLPMLFGVATIYLVYKVARKLFTKEIGVLSAFLVAISPFMVGYSAEARSYSFYGFATFLAFTFLVYKKWPLFFAAMLLMLYTHYISVAFILTFLAFYAVTMAQRALNRNNIPLKQSVTGLELASGAIFTGILLKHITVVLNKASSGLNMDWIRETSILNIPQSLIAYLLGIQVKSTGADKINVINLFVNEYIIGGAILLLLGVLTAYFLYKNLRQSRKITTELVNWFFTVLAFLLPQMILISASFWFDKKIYVERYLFPAAIFFFIAIAFVMYKTLLFEALFFVVIFYVLLLTRLQAPYYYNGMAETAKRLASYGDEIIFVSPIDHTVARYYFLTHTRRTFDNTNNLRLYDFNDRENKYIGWPFIYQDLTPQNLEGGIIISPSDDRVPAKYSAVETSYDLGDYKIFQRQ